MIGERIARARKAKGLGQAALAAAIGDRYEYSMISHVEAGRKSLRLDGLANAARALEVSADYLLGLTDDPTPAADRDSVPTHAISEPDPTYKTDGHQDDPEETIEQLAEVAAAAGVGAQVYDETTTGRVPFRRSWLRRNRINPRHCQLIGVRGESMVPTLPDGSQIIVDRNRKEMRNGRIYVMRTEEGLVVKRVIQNAQGWWLMSDNPAWAPLFLTEETDIIGEVRWAARTF